MKLFTLLAPIITSTLSMLQEKQRTRIQDEYKDLLDRLREAESRPIGEYTDFEIDKIESELEDFLVVYGKELKVVANV